jgi:sugar fermentation stimulation protein A
MQFIPALQAAIFLRRYKRFLADVLTEDGETLTVHCPNTGSMRNCLAPGSPCWISLSATAGRKYPHTWEIATTPDGHLAGINTLRANALVAEALDAGRLPGLQGATLRRSEVPYGEDRSRADFVLQFALNRCVVEVKNVTLLEGRQGFFPDAVTARGSKHLRELIRCVEQGERAALVFCVQHTGVTSVRPAAHIDPLYSRLCEDAQAAGVEFYALRAAISPQAIILTDEIPVIIGG